MNNTATDEQDLAKALHGVAAATNDLASQNPPIDIVGTVAASQTQPSNNLPGVSPLPPIVPMDSPVAPAAVTNSPEPVFPKITPIHDSSDVFYKPRQEKTPAVATADKLPEAMPINPPTEAVTETQVTPTELSLNQDSVVNPSNEPAKIESPPSDDGSLADIKKFALSELRPLVDKLDVAPEEKFDTLLLLLRSSDDVSLIAPAHDAAKAITDEKKRAEALLEVVKEIDYLSQLKKGD